jgi:hypothetical protein
MTSYYIWFVLFAVVVYFIATDESIAAAFYYVTKLAKYNFEVLKWWLLNNPRNPVVKYLMWRRSEQLAKELMDELKNK